MSQELKHIDNSNADHLRVRKIAFAVPLNYLGPNL